MEANWLVIQSESSDDYGPHWIAATPFKELDAAKEYLKHVINDEWDRVEPTTGGASLWLGDNPGYKYPESSSIKHALSISTTKGWRPGTWLGSRRKSRSFQSKMKEKEHAEVSKQEQE